MSKSFFSFDRKISVSIYNLMKDQSMGCYHQWGVFLREIRPSLIGGEDYSVVAAIEVEKGSGIDL